MKTLIPLFLFLTMAAQAQPQDAIGTATASAIDATAYTTMKDNLIVGMAGLTWEEIADAQIRTTAGATFPKDASGEYRQDTTVSIPTAKWNALKDLQAELLFARYKKAWYSREDMPGHTPDRLEWAIYKAGNRVANKTIAGKLRDRFNNPEPESLAGE